MRSSLALVVVASVLVLGGCVAQPSTPAAAPAPLTSSIAEGRWVNGTVVDAELRPVAGAQATAPGASNASTTDASGRFRLTGLPPEPAVAVEVRHPLFLNQTLLADLRFVPGVELRFVLKERPMESRHETVETAGRIACQAAVGSHHGVPGHYWVSCTQAGVASKESVRVPVGAGASAGMVELAWTPVSQASDVLGIVLHLSTKTEELLIAEVHAEPGEHYLKVFTGTAPMERTRSVGGFLDTLVRVEPGVLDDHIPNAGIAVEQEFTLYTTSFFGAVPPPTWSAVAGKA